MRYSTSFDIQITQLLTSIVNNNFSKIISKLQRDQCIPHKNAEIEELILVYTRTAQLKISNLKDTQCALCCVIYIWNKVEYLGKEESLMGTRF